MSPRPFSRFDEEKKEEKPISDVSSEKMNELTPTQVTVSSPGPTVVMTNIDSYIHERQKSQPKDLAEVLTRDSQFRSDTRHRLDLPSYFKAKSYDHTEGKGPIIFRWLFKNKMAIDYAMNVRNWLIVNRTYFPDAPAHLFSSNGGVEEGDSVLGFLPAKEALKIRNAPSERSIERVKSELAKPESSTRFYRPSLGPDPEDGSDPAAAGALQEGRDF